MVVILFVMLNWMLLLVDGVVGLVVMGVLFVVSFLVGLVVCVRVVEDRKVEYSSRMCFVLRIMIFFFF